jgi:hypothetical protein
MSGSANCVKQCDESTWIGEKEIVRARRRKCLPCQSKKPADNDCQRASFRAGDGTRIRDIQLGKLALYQLSYSRKMGERRSSQALSLVPHSVVLPHWGVNMATPERRLLARIIHGPGPSPNRVRHTKGEAQARASRYAALACASGWYLVLNNRAKASRRQQKHPGTRKGPRGCRKAASATEVSGWGDRCTVAPGVAVQLPPQQPVTFDLANL